MSTPAGPQHRREKRSGACTAPPASRRSWSVLEKSRRNISSWLAVEKERSMAPATLPAARNGPPGQKLSVAERLARLM